MTRILLAQFRLDPVAIARERRMFARALAPLGVTADPVDFCDASIEGVRPEALLSGYDGVILGGSTDFYLSGEGMTAALTAEQSAMLARLEPFIRHLIDRDIPTLGICYGHQLLARAAHARVVSDPAQAEKGTFGVTLTDAGLADLIFGGMPGSFPATFVHRESVADLPIGATVLACGSRSRIAALRLGTHVYGLQFHPELDADELRTREAAEGAILPLDDSGGIAPFSDTPESVRVLGNFVRICGSGGLRDVTF